MATINILGIIGDYWEGLDAATLVPLIQNVPENEHIDLHISSPGGSVFDALSIFNTLKERPSTAYIEGLAASAASFLMLAANKVVARTGAMVMIHSPMVYSYGNSRELRESADLLDKIESASMIPMYAKKTGKTKEEIKELLNSETWFTDLEALEIGLVDEADEMEQAKFDLKVLSKLENFEYRNIPGSLEKKREEKPQSINRYEIRARALRMGIRPKSSWKDMKIG